MRKTNMKRIILSFMTAVSLVTSSFASAAVLPSEDIAGSVFYATAEINKNEIKVNFSEEPEVTDFSSIAVYNTKSGEKISTEEPTVMGMSILIPVKETLEKSVEYCVELPENIKSKDGDSIYSSYVYFVSEMDKSKAQKLTLVNETFDNYANNGSKQNMPENWFLRKQGSFNEFKFYSDDEHDKAFQLAINGYVPIVATRNFGKTLDKQFTIEFDYKQTDMNKFIAGEEDPNLMQAVYEATKAAVPSFASIEKLNLNMGFHLAPVAETGERRKDSKGVDLGPGSFMASADWSYVSNDKIAYCTNFFQLYGDRLGFGNWTLPTEGNYVRINLNEWYHVVLEIDMENMQAIGYINGEKIGPYNLPDSYKDAQYGAVAARATFFMENPVKFSMKGGSVKYEDSVTGEEKTYSKPNDSNFVIDNFKVITEAPEFMPLQTRVISVDGEEFAPLQKINSVINKMTVAFSSGVDSGSVTNETLKVTDDSGNTYTYAVSGYDSQNNILELTFDKPLVKNKKYKVLANGILSDLGVASSEYQTSFSLGESGSLYISDAKVTDSNGTEITGSVNAGNTVYFNGYMADSTGENNVINLVIAAYKNDANGETMVGCMQRSEIVNGNEKNIDASNEPLSLTLAENADYVKAFVCITDGYTPADKQMSAAVSDNTICISGEAEADERVNLDIPVSSAEYTNDKNCAMVYRGVTEADDKGVYTFNISTADISTGMYNAYIYANNSKTATECEFIYSTEEDIKAAAAAVNSASDKEQALADNYIKLGINNDIYKAGSDSSAAEILEEYGDLSESDAKSVKDVLNEIYLITAISEGNIENLFEYDDILDLNKSSVVDWLSKKYATDAFRKDVTAKLENQSVKSIDDFYETLTEKFVLAVVALNDGYGNAEEIITAFEDEIGVDADDISDSAFKKVAGNEYDSYAELKKALNSNSGGGSTGRKPSGGSSGGGGSSSGGGGGAAYSSDTKLPTEDTSDDDSALLYDIFEDIEDVIWAKPAIVYLAEQGIINGTSATTFSPNDYIKREEIAKILVNTYLKDAEEGELPFADVNENEWYYPFISKAYNSGVVNGYSESTFGVGDYVTRQDLAVMIYNAATAAGEKYDITSDVLFDDDSEIADYAKTAVYALRDAKAINGMDGANFVPSGKATRAEAAKIIYSLIRL